jgi:2'-5' RNA ligase
LKFLGDVNAERLKEISGAIETAIEGISPFRLQLGQLGVFPSLKRVQVVWVGIGGELGIITQLQRQIESGLELLGFSAETRPFVPHLTLARVRSRISSAERQRLAELIAGTRFESSHIIEVKAVNLMRSQLTKEGAIYSLISSAGFKRPLSTN